MATPEYLSLQDGYACLQPTGEFTLHDLTRTIDNGIAYCRDNKIRALIADITQVSGFPPPTLTERFHFISHWAYTSSGMVIVCLVARPEMVLPDKFGVVIAANRGLRGEVFTEHDKALEWVKANVPRTPFGT